MTRSPTSRLRISCGIAPPATAAGPLMRRGQILARLGSVEIENVDDRAFLYVLTGDARPWAPRTWRPARAQLKLARHALRKLLRRKVSVRRAGRPRKKREAVPPVPPNLLRDWREIARRLADHYWTPANFVRLFPTCHVSTAEIEALRDRENLTVRELLVFVIVGTYGVSADTAARVLSRVCSTA